MSAAEPIFDEPDHPESEVLNHWWKWLLLVVSLIVSDVTIYRSEGYAGIAVFLLVIPPLWAGLYWKPTSHWRTVLIYAMLIILAYRLVCQGFWLQPVVGLWLAVVYAMLLTGRIPHVLESLQYATQSLVAGFVLLQNRSFRERSGIWNTVSLGGAMSVVIPFFVVLVFGFLFVLANPHLMELFGETLNQWFQSVREWFVNHGPEPLEIAFLIFALLVTMGLVRPVNRALDMLDITRERDLQPASETEFRSVLYSAYRNTLIAVATLFAIYMVFEFQTLWFRDFPEGFHYSGYAHEGAFWLTVALGLLTLLLSLIFRHSLLADPRIQGLKKLAWLWSVENLFLAAAVYHRLCIYVGFNGMTRMRVVGFFGISAVVGGFVLVVIKIGRNRRFHWLIRRQLWVLASFIYLYAIIPADAWVTQYNVNRVMAGDPAPSVQFSVHFYNDEGIRTFFPLLKSENEIIREGIRAILSERLEFEEAEAEDRKLRGWTGYSHAHEQLSRMNEEYSEQLTFEGRSIDRLKARERFNEYAYQWY